MKIKYFFTTIVLLILFQSCQEKYPKNSTECKNEIVILLQYLRGYKYSDFQKVLHKYEKYKTYTSADVNREYKTLSDFLASKKTENIVVAPKEMKQTALLGDSDELINDALIYNVIYKEGLDSTNLCTVEYRRDIGSTYLLNIFLNNINPKIDAGKLPPPVR